MKASYEIKLAYCNTRQLSSNGEYNDGGADYAALQKKKENGVACTTGAQSVMSNHEKETKV